MANKFFAKNVKLPMQITKNYTGFGKDWFWYTGFGDGGKG